MNVKRVGCQSLVEVLLESFVLDLVDDARRTRVRAADETLLEMVAAHQCKRDRDVAPAVRPRDERAVVPELGAQLPAAPQVGARDADGLSVLAGGHEQHLPDPPRRLARRHGLLASPQVDHILLADPSCSAKSSIR